ncbi:MAG TPA: helicase-related protein, partial [Bacilli bacterium]|nr:helicase-related protein [Bacilli bacterium]
VLNYDLSPEQQEASKRISNAIRDRRNVLINAVCGAGKTELVFDVIKEALIQGRQVGFAIPRRDVVIEIYKRLKSVFPRNKIVAVYGGNNEDLQGEVVVLTAHQLYRYDKYFDLLIMDETDAFPFHGDALLEEMFKRSCKGNSIMMSATLTDKQIKKFEATGGELITIEKRYHGHPLPVPDIVLMLGILKHFFLIRKLRSFVAQNKPVFVFVPTIGKCEDLSSFVTKWVRGGNHVHSKRENRQQIIEDFRRGKYKYLVTTAVLERGVTVKNLQVIVFESDHKIYSTSTLVQIAGRVGRKKDAPKGEVIFLSDKKTSNMEGALCEIRAKNKNLPPML